MARVTVELRNVERVRRRLAAIGVAIEREPKTGRRYERSNPRRVHRASAPGQAPATDSGDLVRDIAHRVDSDGLGASVESRAAQSAALEFGTTAMAARPFLHPAFERNRTTVRKTIEDAVASALRTAR
jgi:hypothetical protein